MVEKDIHESWAVRERIAVCISANPKAQYLWRGQRAWRGAWMRNFTPCTWTIVATDEQDEKALVANLQFAESLGAKPVRLKGESVADATAQLSRDKHVTQVIFGRSAVEGWRKLLYMNAINRFLTRRPRGGCPHRHPRTGLNRARLFVFGGDIELHQVRLETLCLNRAIRYSDDHPDAACYFCRGTEIEPDEKTN